MLARSTGETRLVMSVDQVPVEWLDYSFVRDAKAADAQNLECVVARLRTGVDVRHSFYVFRFTMTTQ